MPAATLRQGWSQENPAGQRWRPAEVTRRPVPISERVAEVMHRLETNDDLRPVGSSKQWREVLEQATRVAPALTTVLVTGESGTGKEIVARLVHRGSPRSSGPFVALNCGAVPDELFEAELFGHAKGAYTDAKG